MRIMYYFYSYIYCTLLCCTLLCCTLPRKEAVNELIASSEFNDSEAMSGVLKVLKVLELPCVDRFPGDTLINPSSVWSPLSSERDAMLLLLLLLLVIDLLFVEDLRLFGVIVGENAFEAVL